MEHPNLNLRPVAGAAPDAPGVYRYADADGRVLYIGKAKRLDSRLASYFREASVLHERTVRMLSLATSLEWTVCSTEAEALLLERAWISAEQPRFNVALRDGDGYRGVAITNTAIPRIHSWRGRRPDGEVFGPYPNANTDEIIDAVGRVFGLRSCNDTTFKRASQADKACLLGDTGRCAAPCVGRDTAEMHQERAASAVAFLSGKDRSIVERLEMEMNRASESELFELAAKRRDELGALQRSMSSQGAVTGGPDCEALAFSNHDDLIGAALVSVRDGQVRGVLRRFGEADPLLDEHERYAQLALVLLQEIEASAVLLMDRGDTDLLTEALSRDSFVMLVRSPGDRHEQAVFDIARLNADEALSAGRVRRPNGVGERDAALDELVVSLGLRRHPRRIECIDVSHTGGVLAVASIVVMIDGVVRPEQYRRVHIPERLGGDDYASMAWAVRKRLAGVGTGENPDLLLVDGGPGQVAAAMKVMAEIEYTDLAVAGLAKRLEEVWLPGDSDPVILGRDGRALQMLQEIRDEAHRWAIAGHRRRREKAAVRVRLDDVPGVGPKRRKALYDALGGPDGVSRASVEAMVGVPGIGVALATQIFNSYHQ